MSTTAFFSEPGLLTTPWVLAIILLGFLYYILGVLNRARHVLQGSQVAKVAAATLDALRSTEEREYPPMRHKWGIAPRKHGMKTPVLCVECRDTIRPYIVASTVTRCIRCGVAAHDGCLKHVKETCRPVATDADYQPHYWLVYGTTFNNEEENKQPVATEHSKRCVYCRKDIEGGMLPVVPTWVCGYCQSYAHVSCFVKRHDDIPHFKIVSKAYRRALKSHKPGSSQDMDEYQISMHPQYVQPDECVMGPSKNFSLPTVSVKMVVGDLRRNGNYYPAKRGKGSKKKRAWWRRVFASQSLDWSHWEILSSTLPPKTQPILVFINTKSGPQVGTTLRDQFSRLLNPLQVVTLPRHDPMPALRTFATVPRLRIAIVGGDGTIGWIISCVEDLKKEFASSGTEWTAPPIAIMPVGTGNDLARCLGWGSGYSAWKSKGTSNALNEILHAKVHTLDRWALRFSEQPKRKDSLVDKALHMISPRRASSAEQTFDFDTKYMNNYLGVGVDAKVALEFHGIRESHPQWFQSQLGNKLVYTGMGALDVVGVIGDQLDLSSKVHLVCDGKDVCLPKGSQGVVVVNIGSYMGGISIWEQSDGEIHKNPQSMNDGKLEVLAVYGSFHLGKLTVGLSRATRIAQASKIEITTRERIPMQIDGEPFRQDACKIDIEWSSQTRMLSPTLK